MSVDLRIADALDAVDFGQATAVRRGRNPRWPYVPVIAHAATPDNPRDWTEQIPGLAFATPREAELAAEEHIARLRRHLAHRLGQPGNRALREHYGLPRELAELETQEG